MRRGMAVLMSAATAVSCAAALAAAQGEAAFTRQQQADFRRVIDREKRQDDYPGIVAGVWSPSGRFVYAKGIARTRNSRVLDRADVFRLGSITKTMTATLVLHLVQRHRLELDDPLGSFVPGIPYGNRITIRELLNHTSGVPDLSVSVGDEVFEHPYHRWRPIHTIRRSVRTGSKPPPAPFEYSNVNYLLLGLIVKRVTHQPLRDLYQRWVFDRVGLEHTGFKHQNMVPRGIANGYFKPFKNRGFMNTTHWNFSWIWSAGAMVSTVQDLRRWAPALATGRGILSRRVQRLRLQFVNAGEGAQYGLGIFKVGGFLGHPGSLPGYDALMLYSPRRRTTIVALGNTSSALDQFRHHTPPDPALFGLFDDLKRIARHG